MSKELYLEGNCDNCDALIEITIDADDFPTYCPCCGAEVDYEETEED